MTEITTTNPPPSPAPELISGLPNDVALWCLARIPKSEHPRISLVCRTWQSALLSPSLFTTRSLLGLSECFLYLNLRHRSTFHWYVLIRKPNSKISLIPLPCIPIQGNNSRIAQIGTQIQPCKSRIEQIEPSSSRNSIEIQPIESHNSRIQPDSSRSGTKIQNFEHYKSRIEQIEPFSSRTSMKIQSFESHNSRIGQIETDSSSTSVKIQPFDPIEHDSSISIEPCESRIGQIEPSSSRTSIKIQPLESIESPSTRIGIKSQTFGLGHLLYAPKRQPIGPAFAVLGPRIYLIGGSNGEVPSNCVWVFDCRFNVWEEGPRMRVGREFAAAGVVEGKIYVMGGCVVDNWARSKNWAEVFDPVKGLWEAVPSPIEVRDKWMHASAVIGGKVYAMADRGGVVYDVGKGEWGSVTKRLDLGWRGRAAVVGGVLYCYDYLGKIRGYVVEDDRWKELRGVDKRLPKFLCGATMVNFDGKLCVVWEGKSSGKEVEIMCAEIEVKRDVDGGLSGVILWSDVILVVPHTTSIVQCLVVEL